MTFEINPVKSKIQDLSERTVVLRGYLDYDAKKERLEEVNAELEQPDVGMNPKERKPLVKNVHRLKRLLKRLTR